MTSWSLHYLSETMSRYVKAVYEFNTTEAGEIALKVGDVIHVVKQVDGNWLKVR